MPPNSTESQSHIIQFEQVSDYHLGSKLLKPLRAVIFAMGQRPHRMSSLQQPLHRISARGAGRTRH